MRRLRSTAAAEVHAPRPSHALCDSEQRAAWATDTVGAVAVVAPSREPNAANRRCSHRVDRGCGHSQNPGARWREREYARLDERQMARRTSSVALTVVVQTTFRRGLAQDRRGSEMAPVFHRGRARPLDDVIGSSCCRCCTGLRQPGIRVTLDVDGALWQVVSSKDLRSAAGRA
jgi:hypothetical protein